MTLGIQLSTFVLVAVSLNAGATLQECAAVSEPAARLACYDALAASSAGTPAAPAAAPADDFGKDAKRNTDEKVHAHIVGPLKGWKRGTKVTLDNGQVWQSIDEDDVVYPDLADNQAVTIGHGFFSGYWIEIDSIGRRFSARRLK